jgi:hypothetical protein
MGWEGLARIDVEKSFSHQLSQNEIASDYIHGNPFPRQLSRPATKRRLPHLSFIERPSRFEF